MEKMSKATVILGSILIFSFLLVSAELCHAQWQVHGTPPFQFTRFDGVFVPGPDGQAWANKIYFMGGRGASEFPDIWRFDPVTGTYVDTGHDMSEDVGNYTANLISDDGTARGPAIYIIGGTDQDNAGGPIGTVQRYYPQTGTMEALPIADNWTVTVGGNLVVPGGTAVVNNIIYVFGGFESLSAPYFYDGTWAFDPAQPSGSRWTNLSVALNPPRSYIQVAVVGTNIYAMGGDYSFPGESDLDPTDVVEVLNTANIVAGWTTLAPMPVASGEGCGFGFGNLMDIAPGFRNKLYVVGGGDWAGFTTEAMEYDIASNTWNQGFHDLNQARRNCAAAFVPLTTPSLTDGQPGMWVFGGYAGSDNPPYADAEFYPMSDVAATSIPTLNEWGMILMAFAMAGTAFWMIRRRVS